MCRFSEGEYYSEIKEDLENLLKLGLSIESITCDGHKSILKAIKKAMPKVIVQRCLVHLQRMSLIWITRTPKYEAGKELRQILLLLNKIETLNDKKYWIQQLNAWFNKHENFLKEKTINQSTGRYWYTHKFIRRAYYTIKRALSNMFYYLDNPQIPKSTNAIESYFGHLKNHLDLHRGLTKQHRIYFVKWYIYLKNKH